MPYSDHPVFISPASDTVQIWRYMSLSKFINMLTSGTLYFASGKTMADIEWFEGKPTSLDKRFASYTWEDAPDEYKNAFGDRGREHFDMIQKVQQQLIGDYYWEWSARTTYMNCWHLDESESHAMWRIYVTGSEGVCIRSTFKRLKNCLSTTDHNICIGTMKYIDDNAAFTPRGNGFCPFVQKRKFFEYERELRACFMHVGDYEFVNYDTSFNRPQVNASGDVLLEGPGRWAIFRKWPSGIRVPVDLSVLVESVYVHPESPGWFKSTVEDIVNKFGCEFEVNPSAIRNPDSP